MYALVFFYNSEAIVSINVSIHFITCKLPSFNARCEKNIQLFKGLVFGFRKPEPGPNEKDKSEKPPEEPSFPAPISCGGVQHIRVYNVAYNLGDIINDSAKADALISQTGRRYFAYDGVTYGADGYIVNELP